MTKPLTLTFKEFSSIQTVIVESDESYELQGILSEEFHELIHRVLDDEHIPPTRKHDAVTKTARMLIANGMDTGMESDKPKKGSSRAVYFPKESKKIILDGKETELPTAVKIAYPGQVDKYHVGSKMLGQMQNEVETSKSAHRHSVITEGFHPNTYESNPYGVLAPLLGSHPDNHWLEMGRVTPMNAKDFAEATVSESHPKGLKLKHLVHGLKAHWADAHGKSNSYHVSEVGGPDAFDKLYDSDHFNNFHHAMDDLMLQPNDFSPRNMGIWHHPITGKKHAVLIDYGFDHKISKAYGAARERQRQQERGW